MAKPDDIELQVAQVRQLASGRAAEGARVAIFWGSFAPPLLRSRGWRAQGVRGYESPGAPARLPKSQKL